MPGGDGTGPQGKGRKKGRGLGPCVVDNRGNPVDGKKGDETLYEKVKNFLGRRNRQGRQGTGQGTTPKAG